MSLPPLPYSPYLYTEWDSPTARVSRTLYTVEQMREYGQQCYEQGKADAAKGTDSGRTPTFAPYDESDDLK